MINTKNGQIIFDNNLYVLKSKTTLEEFKNSRLFSEVCNEVYMGNGHSNFTINPQNILGDPFIIVVYFNPNQTINFIGMHYCENGKKPDWKDWSEENELLKKQIHDKLLIKYLGAPPYNYEWGTVSSSYDSKSGSSGIYIRYLCCEN